MSDRKLYGKYLEHELRLVQTCIITHSKVLSGLQDMLPSLDELIMRVRKVGGSHFDEQVEYNPENDALRKELNEDLRRDLDAPYT